MEQNKIKSLSLGIIFIIFAIWDFQNPNLKWLGWIMLIAGVILILGNLIPKPKQNKIGFKTNKSYKLQKQ